MTRPRAAAIVLILIGILLAGALLASRWTATVPAEAASTVVARVSADGDMATGCLDRLERPGGWLDLCWVIARQIGGDGDYYVLSVRGTLSGETGGVRWAALRARLVDAVPLDSVFSGWPDGTIEGPCGVHQLGFQFGGGSEEACGLTSGAFVGSWDYRVNWACVGCLLPDRTDRPVVLRLQVKVDPGSVPGWEIGADFGS